MTAQAKLAGFDILWTENLRWRLKIGVFPYTNTFTFPRDVANQIIEMGRGLNTVTLQLDDIEVRNLYVIGSTPIDHPDAATVTVADQRWMWPYVHIGPWRFNWRRKTGDRRWLDEQLVDVQQIVDQYEYARWSTREGGSRWEAIHVLGRVLRTLSEKLRSIQQFSYKMPFDPTATARSVPVDGLLIDTAGHSAVAKALQYFTGVNLYIDADGDIVVVDTISGDDLDYIEHGPNPDGKFPGPIIWNTSVANVPFRGNLRPRHVDVYFTCEYELRHDYLETDSEVDVGNADDDLRLDMVVPTTDKLCDIDGDGDEETAYGTWVTFDQIFGAWTRKGYTSVSGSRFFNHESVQSDFPYGQLAVNFAAPFGGVEADPDRMRAVLAIYENYSQTFRIRRNWMDRVVAWRPLRAAILDNATGERGVAQVFQDFAVKYNFNLLARHPGEVSDNVLNIRGWGERLDHVNTRPAPARVQVLSHDLGIFKVVHKEKYWGFIATVFPRRVVDALNPNLEVSGINTIIEYDIALQNDMKMAFVATFTPGSPQGTQGLYRVRINPTVGALSVKQVIDRDLGECRGPPLEVRIDPQIATARFAWHDDFSDDIKAAFGWGGNDLDSPGPTLAMAENLLVDREHIHAVAKAVAAHSYVELLDRAEGTITTPIHAATLRPAGNMGSVEWSINLSGMRTTTAGFRTTPPSVKILPLLPEGTLRKLGLVLGDLQR